jgi:hypothetical protein
LRNELTEKDIRQKSPAQPGFSFLMFDCSIAAQLGACHVSSHPYFYEVLVVAPAVLCARMREAGSLCREHDIAPGFRSAKAGRELPEKTTAKNFASLITYPHSKSKRFENWLARDRT